MRFTKDMLRLSVLRHLLLEPGSEIYFIRRSVTETLMRPAHIAKFEVTRQRRFQFPHALVGVQVDVLLLHAPPQPLNKHVEAVEKPHFVLFVSVRNSAVAVRLTKGNR